MSDNDEIVVYGSDTETGRLVKRVRVFDPQRRPEIKPVIENPARWLVEFATALVMFLWLIGMIMAVGCL